MVIDTTTREANFDAEVPIDGRLLTHDRTAGKPLMSKPILSSSGLALSFGPPVALLSGVFAVLMGCSAHTNGNGATSPRSAISSGEEAVAAALQPVVTEGTFIFNPLSDKCIDVDGAPGIANGTRLQLFDCETSGFGPNWTATDQQWTITVDGFIRNSLSGRCIDVDGAPGLDNGKRLQLFDCEWSGFGPNGTPTDQRWTITADGFIRNNLSGRCIDVDGAPGVTNGARLQLFDCELGGLGPGTSYTDQIWVW